MRGSRLPNGSWNTTCSSRRIAARRVRARAVEPFSAPEDPPDARPHQPEHGASERRFAAARLAHDAKRAPVREPEAHVVESAVTAPARRLVPRIEIRRRSLRAARAVACSWRRHQVTGGCRLGSRRSQFRPVLSATRDADRTARFERAAGKRFTRSRRLTLDRCQRLTERRVRARNRAYERVRIGMRGCCEQLSAGPSSTTRPPYMAIRSASPATTPRSWVISTIAKTLRAQIAKQRQHQESN